MDVETLQRTELNTASWTSTLSRIANFSGNKDDGNLPCIVLAGKRSSGVATLVRCLVNRLLTQQNSSGLKQNSSVILVDLDHDRPELTPPGLTSAVCVTEPLFGPSFSHSWKDSNLITMYASGILGDRPPVRLILQIMDELLHITLRTASNDPCPIIVRLPEWIGEVEESQLSQLWTTIGPIQLVSMGLPGETTSKSLHSIHTTTSYEIDAKAFSSKVGQGDEAELKMLSYFHAHWQQDRCGGWRDEPLPLILQPYKTMAFGTSKGEIQAIKLHDDQIAVEDSLEATLGSICALLVLPDEDSGREYDTPGVKPSSSHLPRLILPTSELYALTKLKCLGIAFVPELQTDPPGVCLSTPVSPSQLQQNRILLYVLPKRKQSGLVGSTEWIAKEMDAHG
jgi:hypothetical protein